MLTQFTDIMDAPPFADILQGQDKIAVAVSGGPDSMALVHLLNRWSPDRQIHAITVDHGLRAEAAEEAAQVAQWLAPLENVRHITLQWEGDKPATAIQAEARQARYDLMASYCRDHAISALFLAHHQDDQAETLLFRLAKGSGLKGLGGMHPVYHYHDTLYILRPLLDVPKADLIDFCQQESVPSVLDPSNTNDHFARVRLRQSAHVLAEEGMTAKRLSVIAKRLQRAEKALQHFTGETYLTVTEERNTDIIVLKRERLKELPPEIVLRHIMASYDHFLPGQDYLPRMEKLETLCHDLIHQDNFKARTLGGLKFEQDRRDKKDIKIRITREERLVSAVK